MNTSRGVGAGSRRAINISIRLGLVTVMVFAMVGLASAQHVERTSSASRDLATIEQAIKVIATVPDPGAGMDPFSAVGSRVRGAKTAVTTMAARMAWELEAIAATTNPSALEREYRLWAETGELRVIDGLVRFSRVLVDRRVPLDPQESATWQRFAQVARGLVEASGRPGSAPTEADLPKLQAEVWRLRFVESVRGAKERLVGTEAAVAALEQETAQRREAEAIKEALRKSIAEGKPDAALEQRIAALPEAWRQSVETFRQDQDAAKAKQLAEARARQQRNEAALRRQQEIDEAIRLRKEEIDTGRANQKAAEQRRRDPELDKAVGVWEQAYRQEQAEKKAAEARRQLAELERAKVEEQRGREVEAKARRAQEEAARREAIEKRYDVKATLMGDELYVDPFRYEGQAVLLGALRFEKMLDRGVGVFRTLQEREVLISGLPSGMFSQQYQMRPLIVRPKGTTRVTNALGVVLQVPLVEYLATE